MNFLHPLAVILGTIAVIILSLSASLYIKQRKMLYYPQQLSRSSPHLLGMESFEKTFHRNGIQLHGWLINPEKENLIVYYGGNGEEVSYNLESFRRIENHAVLLMNYRGYGESQGSPSEEHLVGDALALFDEMRKSYSTIKLIGRSLGSGVAVQVASKRPVHSLILVTPFDSVVAVGQKLFPFAPVSLLAKDRYDSIAACRGVTSPALFLLAEMDEIIPIGHGINLADHWEGERQVVTIEGAMHNTIGNYPDYWDSIVRFLGEAGNRERGAQGGAN